MATETRVKTIFWCGLLVSSALWAGIAATGAAAAGLGELTLRSMLGQPLNADINVFVNDKRDLDALSARIAPASAHQQAGIPNQTAALLLKATLQTGQDGRTIIRVESVKPVTEPAMKLLIELRSPGTNALREYDLLLDPPEMQRR
jgi:pilus assembly protein FimV